MNKKKTWLPSRSQNGKIFSVCSSAVLSENGTRMSHVFVCVFTCIFVAALIYAWQPQSRETLHVVCPRFIGFRPEVRLTRKGMISV